MQNLYALSKVAKGWVAGPYAPKILALPEREGDSAPCQDFFGGFVHNALRALQSDHLSTKSGPPSPP